MPPLVGCVLAALRAQTQTRHIKGGGSSKPAGDDKPLLPPICLKHQLCPAATDHALQILEQEGGE
jgi:hypothetical protein